jgi:hypothetical protein
MLEQINIIERYDETQKNRGQMSMFLQEIVNQLDELEQQQSITTEDEYALCEWQYVLEEIYNKYRDLVNETYLYIALGLCHVLRKRSAVEGLKKESYYE